MDELLKLLVSNIYIVVIVVGFLLSVLNKARGKQKPGGNRMPSFGEGPNGRPQARPLEKKPLQPERPGRQPSAAQSHQRPAQQAQPSATAGTGPLGGSLYTSQLKPLEEGVSSELAGAEPSLLARTLEAERLAAEKSKSAAGSLTAAAKTQPQTQRDSFRVPQGSELRQAIIMAEVLGPPRSKRPLRHK